MRNYESDFVDQLKELGLKFYVKGIKRAQKRKNNTKMKVSGKNLAQVYKNSLRKRKKRRVKSND